MSVRALNPMICLLACLATWATAAGDERSPIIVAMGADGPLAPFADVDQLLQPPPTPAPSPATDPAFGDAWLSGLLNGPLMAGLGSADGSGAAEGLSPTRIAALLMCEECMTPGVWPAPVGVDLPAEQLTAGGLLGLPGALRIARQGTVQLLPTGTMFRPYLASPKESRLGSSFRYEREDGWLWDHDLGGRFPLMRWGTMDNVFPQGIQLDIEAAAQLRQDPEADMILRSSDFRWGMPLAFGYGRHRTKVGYYHVSSHLADEFLLAGGGPRVNYVRDAVVLAHAVYFWPSLRGYAEVDWGFNRDVSGPWHFQFGADFAPPRATGPWGAPFAAVNAHLRQEVNFSGSLTAQAGWSWRSEGNGRLLRMGASYFTGKSQQYSFFNRHEQLIGLGIWLDN